MSLFEPIPVEPEPEPVDLVARLIRLEKVAAMRAKVGTDMDWGSIMPSGSPYPFIFDPTTGWLMWGSQGGVHDSIVNDLARSGQRVPNAANFGRWYPENDDVYVDDPSFRELPWREQQKHMETIRRNAPGGSQEPASGDAWNEFGLGDQDDWKVAATNWYEDPDQADFQHGLCDTYALAMLEMYPRLKWGTLYKDGVPRHWFAHDDQYAYDSLGRHPLPYTGYGENEGYFDPELNGDPSWELGDGKGNLYYPHGQNGGPEDYERAKALIPKQHPWLSPR